MSTQPSPAPAPAHSYELAGPAVSVANVHPGLMQFVDYLGLVHRVVFNKPLVITSGTDGIHSAGSLHAIQKDGTGHAVDVRSKDLLPDEQGLLLALLAYAGPANHIAYMDERGVAGQEHIHLEWYGA